MNLLLFIIGILTPIVFFIIGYKFANNKFKASNESLSVRENEAQKELLKKFQEYYNNDMDEVDSYYRISDDIINDFFNND